MVYICSISKYKLVCARPVSVSVWATLKRPVYDSVFLISLLGSIEHFKVKKLTVCICTLPFFVGIFVLNVVAHSLVSYGLVI